MISYDKLLQLGFTSDIIDGYLKDGRIIVNEDGYVITNYDLLISIINKTDDSFVFDYSNIQINTMLSNLFRLIRLNQKLLAYELSKRIVDIIEIPEHVDILGCHRGG